MLAELRSTARRRLRETRHRNRGIDGMRGAAHRLLEWYEHLVREHLRIVEDLVRDLDDAEDDAPRVECFLPRGQRLRSKDRIENGDEFGGVGGAALRIRGA